MSKNFELLSPDTEYIIEVTAVGGGSTRRTGQTKSRTGTLKTIEYLPVQRFRQ